MSEATHIAEDDGDDGAVAEAKKFREQIARAQAATVAERNMRIAAERQAAIVADDAVAARADSVTNALEAETQRVTTLKQALAAAHREGNFDQVADLQVELGRVGASLQRLEDKRQEFEDGRKQQLQQPARPVVVDPLEAHLRQFTPRTAAWLRANPQYVSDPVKGAEANLAHNKALRNGMRADTDEYEDFIERELGLRKERDVSDDDNRTPRRTAPAAAPASRQQTGARTVISPDEMEAARWMYPKTKWNPDGGVPPQTYHEDVQKMRQERGWKNGDPFARRA